MNQEAARQREGTEIASRSAPVKLSMHRDDWDETDACDDCGTLTSSARGGFSVDGERLVCRRCAAERGGRYDANSARWLIRPNVDDLLHGAE